MKKIVPDPPVPSIAYARFGAFHASRRPVFAVCPDADLQDALAQLSAALTSAFESNAQLCEMLTRPLEDLAWSTWQSLEICQAVMETLRTVDTRLPEHEP